MPQATIHIPQACAESWHGMTPVGPGRDCAACQQTVVDFTQKTDAEILTHLAQASGKLCGRFRAGQLGRSLQPAETASRWRCWLASVVALGGLVPGGPLRAAAQVPATQRPAVVDARGKATDELLYPARGGAPADTVIEIRGVVLDAERCEPLPGVTVVIQNTAHGTATNMAGEFTLQLKPTEQPVQLVFRSVGFVGQEKTVALQGPTPSSLKLEVALEAEVMGGLLVANTPPWPWHARAFYHWGKHWLTRPFRR